MNFIAIQPFADEMCIRDRLYILWALLFCADYSVHCHAPMFRKTVPVFQAESVVCPLSSVSGWQDISVGGDWRAVFQG